MFTIKNKIILWRKKQAHYKKYPLAMPVNIYYIDKLNKKVYNVIIKWNANIKITK